MNEPVTYHFTELKIASMCSAINWLFGYMEGTGRDVPQFVAASLAPLLELRGEHKESDDA